MPLSLSLLAANSTDLYFRHLFVCQQTNKKTKQAGQSATFTELACGELGQPAETLGLDSSPLTTQTFQTKCQQQLSLSPGTRENYSLSWTSEICQELFGTRCKELVKTYTITKAELEKTLLWIILNSWSGNRSWQRKGHVRDAYFFHLHLQMIHSMVLFRCDQW